jgi:hypothetical protein
VTPVLRKFLADAGGSVPGLEVLLCPAEGNPMLNDAKKTAVPHFRFYRNGALVESVAGPNLPALARALRAHAPKEGEAEDAAQLNRFVRPPTPPPPPGSAAGRPRTADLLARRPSSTLPQRAASIMGGSVALSSLPGSSLGLHGGGESTPRAGGPASSERLEEETEEAAVGEPE